MWADLNQKRLYVFVLFAGALLCIIALGGGLFNQPDFWFNHWQHKAFRGLCHQDPQRSFWLAGTPMAVCSRCFGIYAGFLASWLFFPMAAAGLERFKRYSRQLLGGAILLNIVDVTGNFLGLWQNTLVLRFLLGLLIALSIVLVLSGEFIKTTNNIKGIHYGTDRTTL